MFRREQGPPPPPRQDAGIRQQGMPAMTATILRIITVIALAVILPWLAHAAPSPVPGPEAEARFLKRCA
jgi:hypothetical protein